MTNETVIAQSRRMPQGAAFRLVVLTMVTLAVLMLAVSSAQAALKTRIKDIVDFEGVRDNHLMGYGLVVGLNGTGDKLNNNKFTEQSLISFLERLGINARGSNLKPKNVAAVTITATLPPFGRNGSRVDVLVSALGDAKSLQGGTLLATPLYGADGEVYAVAQGALAVGGFSAGGAGGSVSKGVPTNGYIAGGGIVEKEVDFKLDSLENIKVALKNPDLSTAEHIASAVNKSLGDGTARATDPGTVEVKVLPAYAGNVAGLLAQVENIEVATDQPARVVIDEASGTIVMGENVQIDTVAIAQGNLMIRVEEAPQVSQPNALAGGTTAVTPRTTVSVDEGADKKLAVLKHAPTLSQLVDGLNALGIGPRDMITILQNIQAAGALQAEIVTR